MNKRIELQSILEQILGDGNVYFQPPENLKMVYDCIVYERSQITVFHADNSPYQMRDRYQVTAIYKNPDSELPRRLAMLPLCTHDRHFTSDNLHHDVFTLYY